MDCSIHLPVSLISPSKMAFRESATVWWKVASGSYSDNETVTGSQLKESEGSTLSVADSTSQLRQKPSAPFSGSVLRNLKAVSNH